MLLIMTGSPTVDCNANWTFVRTDGADGADGQKDGRTDGQTGGRTGRRAERRTDGRRKPDGRKGRTDGESSPMLTNFMVQTYGSTLTPLKQRGEGFFRTFADMVKF